MDVWDGVRVTFQWAGAATKKTNFLDPSRQNYQIESTLNLLDLTGQASEP